MLKLTRETEERISRHLGLNIDEIRRMSPEQIDAHIEGMIGKKLHISGHLPVGNGRFVSREECYRRLDEILG